MPTKNTNFGTAGDYYPFLFIGILNIRVPPGPHAPSAAAGSANLCRRFWKRRGFFVLLHPRIPSVTLSPHCCGGGKDGRPPQNNKKMTLIWLSAAGLCGATLIGSLLGFCFKALPHRWNDTVMGFCAGVMLAAAVLGLIVPAAEQAPVSLWWLVVGGALVGALFLNLLDLVTPHLHMLTGLDPEQHRHNQTLSRVMLFVMAIALHKFPEGVAAGVSLTDVQGDGTPLAVTFGIALQNVPEGMVVISPLLLAGVSRLRTAVISLGIGLLEVLGVWTGYALGIVNEAFLPFMLAFAGGAMLYVVSDEMIPETHAHGYQKQATYALVLGFLMLLYLERIF